MVEMRRLGVVLERNSVMAKGQQRSNREKKKPKQDKTAKGAASAPAFAGMPNRSAPPKKSK